MKILIAMCCAVALTTGCATPPVIKTEIVTVNKPVPFIPPPPTIEKITYEVDKLTPADAKIPGKVGQAYVHDMTYLRAVVEIYESILAQYKSSSVDFGDIDKKIQELYTTVETRTPPAPATHGLTVDPK